LNQVNALLLPVGPAIASTTTSIITKYLRSTTIAITTTNATSGSQPFLRYDTICNGSFVDFPRRCGNQNTREMPRTSDQIVEKTSNTQDLVKVVREEKEQIFRDAYITDMGKVADMLKRKCGKDPFRIDV
jgi:archaellum component FlaF (FlaF/FlaG flagellin family)